MVTKQELKESFIEVFINKPMLYLVLSIIIFSLIWFVFDLSDFFKLLSSLVFLIAYGYEIFHSKKSNQLNKFIIFVNGVIFFIMGILTIIYLALALGEIIVAVWMLIVTFILIIVGSLVINFLALIKLNKYYITLIMYIFISFLFISLFGFSYSLAGGYNQGLVWTSINSTKAPLDSALDSMYFSSSVYYSSVAGDIQPVGFSKFLMQLELFLSYLFHVIILGFVIKNTDLRRNKKKVKNNLSKN